MQQYEAVLPLQLKVSEINRCWIQQQEAGIKESWPYGKFLSILCELEMQKRHSSRLKRRIQESSLPKDKTLSSFDFSKSPKINACQIKALADTDSWIKRASNIIIFGPSGVGKSHIAAAIGYRQIELGGKVKFWSTSHIVQLLQQAKIQFRLKELLIKLDKIPLLILDDFGYMKKDDHETGVLFELICQRYENSSLIITANQPFSQWDSIFPDNMMAVAAIDRLVHHATIINIEGESYRVNNQTN